MKSYLYLAKEPGTGVRDDLSRISGEITIVDCLNAYGDYYRKKGYNCISKDEFFESNGMKFDVVIGNPPYQKGKNSDFYVKFIQKSAELTNEGGVVTLVTPNRFILPHTPASKAIVDNFQVEKYWIDVNHHFPGVGQNIGMFKVIRSNKGHNGVCDIELKDGEVIQLDPREITLPSRMPTVEGVDRFNKIKSLNHFTFTKKQPSHEKYVYVCRQWKSDDGRIYFDAEVGHSKTQEKRDGRYIETENPQEVCDYLRTTDYAIELHKLFGDQMNIWPFLWDYIPSCL